MLFLVFPDEALVPASSRDMCWHAIMTSVIATGDTIATTRPLQVSRAGACSNSISTRRSLRELLGPIPGFDHKEDMLHPGRVW